jgi:hypothetical protein
LHIPGGAFANNALNFYHTSCIFFDADTIIDQNLIFKGENSTSKLSASSFTITLDEGGKITLPDSNARLEITNLVLKDFGDSPGSNHFDIHPTSTITFQDCTIEMADNYVHQQGTIEFRDGCKIIHQGHSFNINTGGFLVLNSASLIYDSLNKIDRNPFVFSDENSQKIVINDGGIRSSSANPPLLLEGSEFSFNSDYILTLQSEIKILNPTPGQPANTILDFNGHALTFPLLTQPVLKIAPKLSLTIHDAELFDYNQNCIFYGDSEASISFGNGVKLKFFKTETINPSHRPWNIIGDVIIGGKGAAFTLDGSQRIIVADNATLTFEDLRLVVKNSDSLKLLGQNSKIIFSNCDLVLYDGVEWTIDNGNIEVEDKLRIFGGQGNNSTTTSTLTFASSGYFKVNAAAMLRLGQNVTFKYQANPINDGGSVFASKRHFILQSATSVLEMDGCTMHSTLTGLALDFGRVIVSDGSHWQIDGSDGCEAEIGSLVDFYIKPSVSFTFTGTLTYNQSSL